MMTDQITEAPQQTDHKIRAYPSVPACTKPPPSVQHQPALGNPANAQGLIISWCICHKPNKDRKELRGKGASCVVGIQYFHRKRV